MAWAGMGTRSVKKKGGEGQKRRGIAVFAARWFRRAWFNRNVSDLWALCERVGVTFLVGGIFNLFGCL